MSEERTENIFVHLINRSEKRIHNCIIGWKICNLGRARVWVVFNIYIIHVCAYTCKYTHVSTLYALCMYIYIYLFIIYLYVYIFRQFVLNQLCLSFNPMYFIQIHIYVLIHLHVWTLLIFASRYIDIDESRIISAKLHVRIRGEKSRDGGS